MKLLIGVVGGAAIGFLLGSAILPPARADVVEAAEDFVPTGITDVRIEPLTGSPVIVGHQFFVVVDMTSEASSPIVLGQRLVDEANRSGWRVVTTGQLGPMRTYEFARWPMTAEARVGSQLVQGEPTDIGTAHVRIEADEEAIFRAVAGVSVLGAAAGVGAAFLLGRIFRSSTD